MEKKTKIIRELEREEIKCAKNEKKWRNSILKLKSKLKSIYTYSMK